MRRRDAEPAPVPDNGIPARLARPIVSDFLSPDEIAEFGPELAQLRSRTFWRAELTAWCEANGMTMAEFRDRANGWTVPRVSR